MNSFGVILRLSTFGESHGTAVGGVLDGFPAGVEVNMDSIRRAMLRRRPGQSALTTQRKEADEVDWLSGIFEGRSTGAPIAFLIKNTDARSGDYDALKEIYRPGHADAVYDAKYGIRDHRGGGRSSARETAVRVVAGALAAHIIPDVQVRSLVASVGSYRCDAFEPAEVFPSNASEIPEDSNPVRTLRTEDAESIAQRIETARSEGDSLGGEIQTWVRGVPAGWGEPIYDKLTARLAAAMMSINATKGVEFGSGFAGAAMRGSEHNDQPDADGSYATHHSGGFSAGISNGRLLRFNTAFKPTSTISRSQRAMNRQGEVVQLEAAGRHDPCVLPRAVPVVDAMTYLVLADFSLLQKTRRL